VSKIITFGEALLRLATPGHLRFSQASNLEITFCGAEVNVAATLAAFGVDVDFVTRVPNNDISDSCLKWIKAADVGVNHVLRGGGRMGIFYLEKGATVRPSKVIYDREGSSFASIGPGMINWRGIFDGAKWFHWSGITPAVSSSAADACQEAVEIAVEMGLTVSCDLNYRQSLWGGERCVNQVMRPLVEKCDVIVGNEEDCQKVFGVQGSSAKAGGWSLEVKGDEFMPILKEMSIQFPKAESIALSCRDSINADHNKWSGTLYKGGMVYSSRTYDITDIVDRVGAGDAFMGGLIYGFLTYPENSQMTIDFAVAASCLKHTIHGDFNRVSLSEVDRLMDGNDRGRVIR